MKGQRQPERIQLFLPIFLANYIWLDLFAFGSCFGCHA